jgi:inhibitor of cysteine peptidase
VQVRSLLLALPLLTAFVCHSVLAQQASPPSHARAPAGVVLTDRDNGSDVDLAPNTPLIVKLTSNPSTGYAWAVVGDPSPLKLQKTSFRKGKTKNGTAGASGTAVLQLSANSAGMATLTLVYRRSWEYNLPPMKTFGVRVNVR